MTSPKAEVTSLNVEVGIVCAEIFKEQFVLTY